MVKGIKSGKDNMKQNDINVTTEMLKEQVIKISNRKSPGPDGVQSYWLKKGTTLHECLAKHIDNIISNIEDIPKSMTLGTTVLC